MAAITVAVAAVGGSVEWVAMEAAAQEEEMVVVVMVAGIRAVRAVKAVREAARAGPVLLAAVVVYSVEDQKVAVAPEAVAAPTAVAAVAAPGEATEAERAKGSVSRSRHQRCIEARGTPLRPMSDLYFQLRSDHHTP